MNLFATAEDQSHEEHILEHVKPHIEDFDSLTFEHQTGASLFDFHGFYTGVQVCEVDVKVRDAFSETFKDYFISTDKIHRMRAKPDLSFYMIFYFTKDRRVRVYNLRSCALEEKEISFTHKRSGELIEKKVSSVPAGQFIFDAYIL